MSNQSVASVTTLTVTMLSEACLATPERVSASVRRSSVVMGCELPVFESSSWETISCTSSTVMLFLVSSGRESMFSGSTSVSTLSTVSSGNSTMEGDSPGWIRSESGGSMAIKVKKATKPKISAENAVSKYRRKSRFLLMGRSLIVVEIVSIPVLSGISRAEFRSPPATSSLYNSCASAG